MKLVLKPHKTVRIVVCLVLPPDIFRHSVNDSLDFIINLPREPVKFNFFFPQMKINQNSIKRADGKYQQFIHEHRTVKALFRQKMRDQNRIHRKRLSPASTQAQKRK